MHELLPLLMSIPVKFLMAISGESVSEAMDAMLETMERDLRANLESGLGLALR